MIAAIELGLIYAVLALGVYLTFRILNFPDLTVDGSLATGGAVAAILLTNNIPPVIATLAGAGAGACAGLITGVLHTWGRIDGLLAGILTMIALWSINLRIMETSNIQLLRIPTLFTPLKTSGTLGTISSVLIFLAFVVVLKVLIDWFLATDLGLAIQATGDNQKMIRSLGVNTHRTTVLTLMLSNALAGLCGALFAQYQGYADVSMGIGTILIGLASVIVGQAIIRSHKVVYATCAVVLGAVLYRLVIYFALLSGLHPNDTKLISAVLVIACLVIPRFGIVNYFAQKANFNKSMKAKQG